MAVAIARLLWQPHDGGSGTAAATEALQLLQQLYFGSVAAAAAASAADAMGDSCHKENLRNSEQQGAIRAPRLSDGNKLNGTQPHPSRHSKKL